MHFKLTGPASGDGIDTDRPENDGYSRSAALGFLENLEARGHTFDEVDTDELTLEERKQLYFGRVAEFDLYASRSRRKGERIARVYQGYDPEVWSQMAEQLGDQPAVIGRLPDCAVSLADGQVSRRHAEVRPLGEGFAVADLGSMNGTTVNGVAVRERELEDGDEIGIGSTTIRFEAS